MKITQELLDFIHDNLDTDTTSLIFNSRKYPQLDMNFVVEQILSRRHLKYKLPEWYANREIIIPSRISSEQCSSELTAIYKQRLIKGDSLCDLTGGMGVDSYYFAKKTKKSIYIERFDNYCECALHNFKVLGIDNISVINANSLDILDDLEVVDTIYIDPARRSDTNKRLFALKDCEPNILDIKDKLFQKCKRIIVKVSPMADISETIKLLEEISEVHVVSVNNECKELLFVLDKDFSIKYDLPVYCVNFKNGKEEIFKYIYNEENTIENVYCDNIEGYLYEPNSSILKAGAFKTIGKTFLLKKIQKNTHLYVYDKFVENFPGRVFRIEETIDFASSILKRIASVVPKANITTRNFTMSVDEIRKKTKIKEGGDVYIFAVIDKNNNKVLVKCCKL
ncbi:MAG: SAM-dependent methyltransferase [Bacteroidales bacterium]|nr:SAM-dependent methyltransferase [Bacteroidales bacterium]